MPGIVGLVSARPKQWALDQLNRMVAALLHESFYVSGTWFNELTGVYVGWVTRRHTENPFSNEKGDVTLVFTGDHYADCGSPYRGHRDVLRLYEEDPGFPRTLNGMFQGVVVDHRTGTATLFNDRYGMHRLYCHQSDEAFYFGAEAKAILAVRPETRAADFQGLAEFVSFGCALDERTVFRGMHLIPAAESVIFRRGMVERRQRYFHPREWEEQEPLSPEAYYAELRSAFATSLPVYLGGSEQCALALTGGLDTRLIMAWAKAAPSALPCYTFGGMLGDSRDVRIGRKVAELCHQSHEVIRVGQEYLSRFAHYAERCAYLGEGCLTVSNSADLYVSERARQVAPAKIVGTWGSEILRRAVTFKPAAHTPGLFQPEFAGRLAEAEHNYALSLRRHRTTFTAFHQNHWFQYGIEALEQTQLTVRAPFLANNLVRTAYRAPTVNGADVRLRLIKDGNLKLAAIPSDRGVSAEGSWFGEAGMLFEELTFKAEYAFDMGMPNWLAHLNRAVPLPVERLFLGRHKFLHFRKWYRECLSEYVKSVLLDSRTLARPYLQKRTIEKLVNEHVSGRGNHTETIHTLLTLEHLQRQLFGG